MDTASSEFTSHHPVIFFDGVCGLCNGFVDFALARDRRGVFRFATLQGETAKTRIPGIGRPAALSEEVAVAVAKGVAEGVAVVASAKTAAEGPTQGIAMAENNAADFRSVILWDSEGVHRKSDAVLRVLEGLGGAWRLARLLRLVPRGLRDSVYDFTARNRYRWFGKRETCRLPSPAERERFLD